MKKPYIAPEAKLYSLKFDENIAVSGEGMGDDAVSGSMIILFTHSTNPCRGCYTGNMGSPNTKGDNATFFEYLQEMLLVGAPGSCLQQL